MVHGLASQSEVPLDKFGWFYRRNGTTWSDGVLNMATGVDKVKNRVTSEKTNKGRSYLLLLDHARVKGYLSPPPVW